MLAPGVFPTYLLTHFLLWNAFTWERLRRYPWQQPRPNCRYPSPAILRPVDPHRHPVPVPMSEAVDGRSAEAGVILLQRGRPCFELAATLLTRMNWGLAVDDLAD